MGSGGEGAGGFEAWADEGCGGGGEVGAVVEEGGVVWGEGEDGPVGAGEEGNGVDDGDGGGGGGGDNGAGALAGDGVVWGFEEWEVAAEANGWAGG